MNDALFDKFDFSIFDSGEFLEDAVREEIIAPILKKLGYTPSGPNKVRRSKPLTHPYVMIGSQKKEINIVPDYTIEVEGKPRLILDAKNPAENIYAGNNVAQAYSYAIHPDVRVQYYALCNGRNLVVFHIYEFSPKLDIAITEIDSMWDLVHKLLSPFGLTHPEHFDYKPDLGIAMTKAGFSVETMFHFLDFYVDMIIKESDSLYLFMSTVTIDETDYLATVDVDRTMLLSFLEALPPDIKRAASNGLSHQPFCARLDRHNVSCNLEATLSGQIITGNSKEEYVPLLARQVTDIYIGGNEDDSDFKSSA